MLHIEVPAPSEMPEGKALSWSVISTAFRMLFWRVQRTILLLKGADGARNTRGGVKCVKHE